MGFQWLFHDCSAWKLFADTLDYNLVHPTCDSSVKAIYKLTKVSYLKPKLWKAIYACVYKKKLSVLNDNLLNFFMYWLKWSVQDRLPQIMNTLNKLTLSIWSQSCVPKPDVRTTRYTLTHIEEI